MARSATASTRLSFATPAAADVEHREPGEDERRRGCRPAPPPAAPRRPPGSAARSWDRNPPGGLRSVGARVEHRPDFGPIVMEPGAELRRLHAIDAGDTGVLLDASERRRQIASGEELLPEVAWIGAGVRLYLVRRRKAALLFAGSFGLRLGIHCAKARRVLGWLLWLPSADSCRVAGPLERAGVGRHASRPTSRQVSPDKGSNLPRAPAASTLRSLDALPTPPRGDAVGFGLWFLSSDPRGTFTPELLSMPGVPTTRAGANAPALDSAWKQP